MKRVIDRERWIQCRALEGGGVGGVGGAREEGRDDRMGKLTEGDGGS